MENGSLIEDTYILPTIPQELKRNYEEPFFFGQVERKTVDQSQCPSDLVYWIGLRKPEEVYVGLLNSPALYEGFVMTLIKSYKGRSKKRGYPRIKVPTLSTSTWRGSKKVNCNNVFEMEINNFYKTLPRTTDVF